MGEALACRSCGGALVDLGPCPANSAGIEPGRLYRCRQCDLGQRHPIPAPKALAAMYRETAPTQMDYEYEKNAAWSAARGMLLSRHGENADITVLDVGCHTGAFLSGLPATWRRFGIESAREPLRIARETHAVTLIGERIEEIDPRWQRQFDAVAMFDVLEHLVDPAAGIAAALGLVKPGGILLVSTANLDAWTWRWLGSGHWYLQTEQHLCVLSRTFLSHVASQHGAKLADLQAIPHRREAMALRFNQALQALYWGMRQRRGTWRLPHRLLPMLPGLGKLRHMQSVPWTMALQDHMIATLTVNQATAP